MELYDGIVDDTIPHLKCGGWTLFVGIVVFFHLDFKFFKLFKKQNLYPEHHPNIYWTVVILIMSLGYLGWAGLRAHQLWSYLAHLTKIFSEAGLKTVLGNLPAFISDREIDPHYRVMTLNKNGVSFSEFKAAKEKLSEAMLCYIEEIRESREHGRIEIRYSEKDFDKVIDLDSPNNYSNYSFTIGNTRIGKQTRNLSDVPHLLVGGTSKSGKSTFLRQFVVTLYLNNPSMQFTLIDLKYGLESICFQNLPRVDCITESRGAVKALEKLEKLIEPRAKILLANKCEKIEEFLNIPVNERIFPETVSQGIDLSRHLIVIDEAAELFLAGANLSADYVMKARRTVQTLCAQGRAVGIHVVVSTQRPDMRIVDMAIKSNLQGRICFYMSDHASSMTILDNGRASDLPNIAGRAIWKNGSEIIEIQVPQLTNAQANIILDNLRVVKKEEPSQPKISNVTNSIDEIDLEKDA